MRIFLAGATGAIGRRLVPLLLTDGHAVTGTTRSREKAVGLRKLGADAVVLDVFDFDALSRAIHEARPEVVIHQLTDLPQVFDPFAMAEARVRNARLRELVTPVLMRAAGSAGAKRAVVQSICFVYRPGKLPADETDPIDSPSVEAMERAALTTAGIAGIVLRCGRLWGPGTWTDVPKDTSPLHVDAAAHAALLAVTRGAPGTYNIAEDDGTVSIAKARRELKFSPDFRLPH